MEFDFGNTCELLFRFMTWFTCLCLVILGYMNIAVYFYCLPENDVYWYPSRIVFSNFGVIFILTPHGVDIVVFFILFRVVVVSSWIHSTIGTLGGVILAGVNCDVSILVTSMGVLICGHFCDTVGPCLETTSDVWHVYFFVEYLR